MTKEKALYTKVKLSKWMKQMKMRSCICTEPKKMIAMELLQEIFWNSCPGNIFTGKMVLVNNFFYMFPSFFQKEKNLNLSASTELHLKMEAISESCMFWQIADDLDWELNWVVSDFVCLMFFCQKNFTFIKILTIKMENIP